MSTNNTKIGAVVCIVVIIASVGFGLYLLLPPAPSEIEVFKIVQIENGDLSHAYARENHESILRVASEFNTTERPIEVSASFNVGPADFRTTAESYILDGYDLIFVTDVTFEGTVLELAGDYPDVYFIGAGGWSSTSATGNISVMAWDIWKGYYLAGIIAGSMTESGSLGWISAFDFPDNARVFNMLMAGAQSYNASVTGQYLFTGDWQDSILSAAAASTLISNGADVLCGVGGLVAGIISQVLLEDKYYIGYDWDEYDLAPSNILTSVMYNRDAYLREFLGDVFAGTFGGTFLSLGIGEGAVNIAPYHDFAAVIPQDAQDLVTSVIANITAGTFTLPVVSTTMP